MKYNRQTLDELIGAYGSPLYLVDGDKFVSEYRRLENAFREIYSNYRIAYSVKTNYTPYICGLVRNCGGIAEVVSCMEYDLARKVGFSPADIIFNGPFKKGALERALIEGAAVIVDNAEEAQEIICIAKFHPGERLRVGLRLNFDIGTNKVSRFGFDIDSDGLKDVVEQFGQLSNVRIAGIHCHFTGARDLVRWGVRAKKMISLSESLFSHDLDFIDLGSGMYGSLEPGFSKQFAPNIPTFEDYSKTVATLFAETFGSFDVEKRPVLITEPGTTLVASVFDSVATVVAIKKVRGKIFAILDTSSHILGGLSCSKNLPLRIIRSTSSDHAQHYDDVDFVGYTCLEYDVVYRGYSGPLSVGDYVLFGNVGSYSNGMKPPFICPGCAAVAFDRYHEKPSLVKRRETMSDVFSSYIFSM